MTTKVTIEAHAGLPVDVVVNVTGTAPRIERVERYTKKDFYVYSTQSLVVIEATDAGWEAKPEQE